MATMTKIDVNNVKSEASRVFYAGVGANDLAMASVRDAVVDARKKATERVSGVQGEIEGRVSAVRKIDLAPTTLRTQATGLVDAVAKDAKARRAVIEAKIAELQGEVKSYPTKAKDLVTDNVETVTSQYVLLAQRGQGVVTRLRNQEQVVDTVQRVTGVTGTVTGAVDKVTETVTDAVEKVAGTVTGAIAPLRRIVGRRASEVADTVEGAAEEVVETLDDAKDDVVDAATKPVAKPAAKREPVAKKPVAKPAAKAPVAKPAAKKEPAPKSAPKPAAKKAPRATEPVATPADMPADPAAPVVVPATPGDKLPASKAPAAKKPAAKKAPAAKKTSAAKPAAKKAPAKDA